MGYPSTTTQNIEVAAHFAAALDSCDYSKAAEFLAANCRYLRAEKEELVGAEAILRSYRDSDVKAHRDFEAVHYRSEVATTPSGHIQLSFFDELHRGGFSHTFRCAQIVYFDGNQKIERIEHVELPGERDRLKDFCDKHSKSVGPT